MTTITNKAIAEQLTATNERLDTLMQAVAMLMQQASTAPAPVAIDVPAPAATVAVSPVAPNSKRQATIDATVAMWESDRATAINECKKVADLAGTSLDAIADSPAHSIRVTTVEELTSVLRKSTEHDVTLIDIASSIKVPVIKDASGAIKMSSRKRHVLLAAGLSKLDYKGGNFTDMHVSYWAGTLNVDGKDVDLFIISHNNLVVIVKDVRN